METGIQESWNMATETMKRLSNLLDSCVFCFQGKNLLALHDLLSNLRRNLAPFLEDNEFKELNDLFSKLPKERWVNGEGIIIPKYYNQIITVFDEIYIFCGRQMKKKGLLMPPSIDKGRSIIGM